MPRRAKNCWSSAANIRPARLDPLRWGLIPYWCNDPKGGRKPINAKCETVRDLPTFRDAYRKRRCIVPVDGFFEWRATKVGRQAAYAIAMKDGAPWPISTRVNKPENDDPSIVEPIRLETDAA
jgi:putative SOS response-associated peptidase YedK